MSDFFSVSVNKNDLDSVFADLASSARKAIANALNNVGRRGVTLVENHVSKNYNVQKPSIRKLVKIIRAHAKASPGGGKFIARVKRQGRGLYKYDASRSKGGVQYSVRRGQRKKVKSGFISTWRKGGGRNFVFVSKKKFGTVKRISTSGTAYQAAKRKALFGPSIATLFTGRGAFRVFREYVEKSFEPELDEQFVKIYG